MEITQELLDRLAPGQGLTPETITPEQRATLTELGKLREQIIEDNPLARFHACPHYCGSLDCPEPSERNPTGGRPKQHEFMGDLHEIVATNAGNRFGKTTAMVVWVIIQHTPDELLPERLKQFKRATSKVVQGRYMLPSEDLLEDTILPTFKEWCPQSILRGGSWKDGYRRSPGNVITFRDGGKCAFYTYKQDPAVLAAATLDYIMWDEPPPEGHWRESAIRTLDRGGCHKFGMTPVNMIGGGIGWIKREIWDKANPEHPEHDPDIHVVRASIWDNPSLSPEAIEKVLRRYPGDERQAREFGDFIHFGGMVYPNGFNAVLRPPPTAQDVQRMDVVVGIDPGLKNAAFIWVAFDNDNKAVVFDEVLLKEKNPEDYANAIKATNRKWGIKDPAYVVDASAANRPSSGMGHSIEALLNGYGIYCNHADRSPGAPQAGVQQVRDRMVQGGLYVSTDCRGLRAEADEYRMEDRPDGEFKVVKENDHRLDALRYAVMERLWYAHAPEEKRRSSAWVPGTAPSQDWFTGRGRPPMGAMS